MLSIFKEAVLIVFVHLAAGLSTAMTPFLAAITHAVAGGGGSVGGAAVL